MRYTHVVFDLDGTLVDSLPGIEASARYAIGHSSLEVSPTTLRECIGPPIADMFARLWPELPSFERQRLVADLRQHYDADGCLQGQIYPEVAETLARLQREGVEMFLLTNKPLAPTRRILEHLGIASHFRAVISPDSRTPPFEDKPAGAAHLAEAFALPASSTLLIGDGLDDLRAAMAQGWAFLLAGYGYGSARTARAHPDQRVAKTFSEIWDFML
jgi:phosphoglycolate phosphatase